MRDILAIAAGIIGAASTLPYIVDTLRGKTHPNIVTWFTWTLLNVITAFAAAAGGARQTTIFAAAFAICTGAVVIAGLKHGLKKYTTFDIVCQLLALCGIVLWQVTDQPALAILINVITDCAGVLPTYRHSWKAPHAETWQAFAIGGVSAILAVCSVAHFDFVSAAYPIYILLSDASLVWVILYRRRQQGPARAK